METLLAFLGSLPSMAVYGLIGAVMGGLGAVIARPFERMGWKWARVLIPVIAVVLSLTLTREFILPRTIEAKVNEDLPQMVDEVTKLVRIDFRNKSFVYHYELDDSVPSELDIAEVKAGGLADLCNRWGPSLKSGSIRSAEYRYLLHGRTRSFTIDESDC